MTIDNSLQFALLLFLSSDFCLGHVELPRTETGPNERNELEVPSLKSFVENYLAEDSLGRLLESILLEQEQWKELSMLQERKIKALETELQQQKQVGFISISAGNSSTFSFLHSLCAFHYSGAQFILG